MQGTVSVLFGCHSIIHSFLVIRSWKILYGSYPKFWEFVCILLHDIGHWGKDYLSDYEQKKKHWRLGANIAWWLFGTKGYLLCAKHCEYSTSYMLEREPKFHCPLYKADKYSWYIAPTWWLWWTTTVEPKLKCGLGKMEQIRRFQAQVKESIESGEYKSTHEMYRERLK